MVHVDVRIPHLKVPAELICKVDTGAQGNVLPLCSFKKIFPSELDENGLPKHSDLIEPRPYVRLDAYNGSEIPQYVRVIKLKLKYNYTGKEWIETEFYLAHTPGAIFLGKQASISLGIITVNAIADMTLKVTDTRPEKPTPIPNRKSLIDLYPDRFTGLGKFEGKLHIDLKENVKPVVQPPRKYPIHLKDEFQAELDKMVQLGVIEPIPEYESTEWLSSLAFSRKESGKLRVCVFRPKGFKCCNQTYIS